MSLYNTKDAYGWVTILLHWIVAIGVIAMFTTGLLAAAAEDQGDRAARGAYMGVHVSTGATLAAFFAARIAMHYGQVTPVQPPQAKWLNITASVVQNLLLLGLLIQIVSGPLVVWSGGRDINVFGLVSLPTPFSERSEPVHEFAEVAHLVGRALIFTMLIVHVLGALKHLVFDRDGVFLRILRPRPLTKST